MAGALFVGFLYLMLVGSGYWALIDPGTAWIALGVILSTTSSSSYEKHGFRMSGRASDFHGMELFEYVKILKDQAPGATT